MAPAVSTAPSEAKHGDMRHYDSDKRRMSLLLRYMQQDRYLVRRKQAYIAYVQRKLLAGKYNAKKATKLWGYWIAEGVKRYVRAHPRVDQGAFSPAMLQQLAGAVAVREHTRTARGDYPNMTTEGTMVGNRGRVDRW